jgi:beta-glucanase (GH16 family)
VEWSAERIDAFVDGKRYFTVHNEGTGWQAWPFDKRFHVILNVAVGGEWGGQKGVDTTIFPVRMEVDYVRLYEPVH